MHNDFRITRPKRDQNTGEYLPSIERRHHSWVAVAAAVVGAGASIYGANKQSKANEAAANANAGLQDKQNASEWASYLMQRGVNPQGAAAGVIPENPQAINAKLPLWASVKRPGAGTPGFRLGAKGKPSLAMSAGLMSQPAGSTTAPPAGSTADQPKTSQLEKAAINIQNPLGIGGSNKKWYDPLGIF